MDITVVKRDGSVEPYDGYKIAQAIEDASRGLDPEVVRTTQLLAELEITLFDRITSQQLDESVIQVAVQNVKDDPGYDVVAARLLLKTLYKRVLGDYDGPDELRALHRRRFGDHVRGLVAAGLLDTRLGELFDLDRLAAAVDPARDDLLRYVGVVTLTNRYAVHDLDRQALEVPQYVWMRAAMGLSLLAPDPTASALEYYASVSRLHYLPAGSTLVNVGTPVAQLSNCFVMQMDDDIDHIARSVRDVMWLTKGTGGIGLSVTKLRAEGSPIRSNNTASTGPVPFMHTIDSTLRAVSRGGKKFGALCFYMENWHLDFPQFLDLRQSSGDPYRRTRTANTAVWISDEFMRRVEADEPWYLFDPAETPDLVELTGAAFGARYAEYVAMAEAGQLRAHATVGAREQLRAILTSLQTTSHPWLTWKDTVNTRALNDNTGTIHLSNLCTEITLPQDRDETSVCNLASVNLAHHLRADVGELDWDLLRTTVRRAVRHLDDLVDVTRSSVPEADRSNERNRAVGLGMMGFTDLVEQLGLSYESEEAYELVDRVTEFVSFHAISASADLAAERGAYPAFAGSGWSRGLLPVDTLDVLAADRGVPVDVDRTRRQDWESLRRRTRAGMRNATVMAIAPTASIGLVAGTTPGLDPQFTQLFARSTSSGKFLEVNRNLVAALKERGLWEQVREPLLAARGDLSQVPGVPADLQRVYRTSFQLSPYAFLEVAARAQKWVDQAISRNMYLSSRDVGEMVDVYTAAWRRGVKTTYYLHMLPRHNAEQSTVRVNKAEEPVAAGAGSRGPAPAVVAAGAPRRRGFGGVSAPPPTAGAPQAPAGPSETPVTGAGTGVMAVAAAVDTCPVDPQERLDCEACQ
ncbi:ribonucleoside-diphosphate reductase subunit alpha [Aquipuribacter hungaricus]|uniref:Ribonucleoside-diphosphate reductase n=1 Tax=Aquipuribacter hungaricus TaxID=545624 RepID=A0ABV7WG06_9MICO